MAESLSINGLVPPVDFPTAPFEEVYGRVASTWPKHKHYSQFSGAWNAIAYRFCGMADAGEQFSHSLSKHGDAPPPQERRVQETQLFQFFSNGFSVFESYFYGLFAIGHFIDGPSFAIETARDQQAIGPARTRDAFSRSGLSAALVGSFDALFADAEYAELKVVRNILSHRAAPGRVMFAGLGSDVLQAAEWKINSIKLDATMTENRRKGMSRLLGGLLLDADRFVKAHSGVTP